MNPQRLSNSWREHYNASPSNDSGNKNIKAFTDALDCKVDDKTRLRNLTESEETVFLVAGADKNIVLFHSPSNLGGTRYRQTNKVIASIGMGSAAFTVELNVESLLSVSKCKLPALNEIKECN
jgi:hypothetical protein